jgi:hypothetical protein
MTRIGPGSGSKPKNRDPLHQPAFDKRIQSLHIPGSKTGGGQIQRGYMIWDQVLPGYSHRCIFRFLYNPTTVEASYSVQDSGIGASLVFPNSHDQSDLRIPVNQYASWSLLYDRTYELWGSYKDNGTPRHANFAAGNNPQVVGCWADVLQLQEFTGMNVDYSVGTGGVTQAGTGGSGGPNTLAGHQGIMMLIPAWVFFGGPKNLHYYGYVSSWDVTYTHFTQYMVPMRAAVDISFTLLPPTGKQTNWAASGGGWEPPNFNSATVSPSATNPGKRSGR